MELAGLKLVGVVAKAALAGVPPQKFCAQTLPEVLSILGMDVGAVYLLQDETLHLFAHHGLSPEFAELAAQNPVDHPHLGRALRERKLVLAEGFSDPATQKEGIKVAAYLPLMVGDQKLGVLALGKKKPWSPTAEELASLEHVSSVFALGLAFSLKLMEITDLVQSLEQFAENELVGVYVIQDGKIVYANAGMCRIGGYSREEFLGRNYLDFVHPEDRELVKTNLERRLRGEVALKRYRFRALRKDGEILTLEVQAWPIIYRGRPAVQGILLDVTWEAEAERLRRSLLSVAREILGTTNIQEILTKVAKAVVEYSPFRRAVVTVYDLRHDPPLLGPVMALASAGLTPEEEEKIRTRGLLPEMRPLAFQEEFRIGRSYYIPHDRVPWGKDVGLPGRQASPGWHPDDFLFIPLRGQAGIIGHISVDEPVTPKEPTLEILEPLEIFADLAALAVERAFQMEELKRHKEWLQGAFKLSHKLAHFETVQEMLVGALESLQKDVHYEFGAILLMEGEELVVAAAHSVLPGPRYVEGQRVPLTQGIVGWVARNRKAARVGNVSEDPRYFPLHPEIKSELAVPIVLGQELLGVLDVESTELERFRAEDEEFLSAVADLLAMSIAGLKARENLRDLSYRDPLTNLYNRRYLFEVLAREVKRAQRYRHPFSVVLLDLDNFRRVNNVFGHMRGDAVLKGVGELLLRNLRACDFVFRYGGDEFLLLLPETEETGAEEAVKRVRAKLRTWSMSLDLGFVLDFSAGVATYDPENSRPPEDLLREADQKMYATKKARLG